MPVQLLPRSAEAFAPRSKPRIVLNNEVEPWLTATLKRINKIKRPLNSVPQHFRCLTETLGGDAAIWCLAYLLLPKAPESDLLVDDDPLKEALENYNMTQIEAYVVHVDMVSQHEVAFKLTTKTIECLVEYHKDVYCVDVAANTIDWPEKDAQVKKMRDDFVQAVNRFVFRTGARALEGLEEDGAGELLDGRSAEVKKQINNLFAPLLPPPPRIVDLVAPAPIFGNPAVAGQWWEASPMMVPQQQFLDPWHVLPSTPSPTSTHCSDGQQPQQMWSYMGLDPRQQLPSPTPSYSQPPYTSTQMFYSSPPTMAPMQTMQYPSQLPLSCASNALGAFDGFGMTYNPFPSSLYAATM